jgi:hypothetical protein
MDDEVLAEVLGAGRLDQPDPTVALRIPLDRDL